MCQVPNYVLFSNNTASESEEVSCSIFIVDYLIQFISLFTNYCMWHTKICMFQMILCFQQWFKMPSLSRDAEEEYLLQERKRIKKILKYRYEQSPKKILQIEK